MSILKKTESENSIDITNVGARETLTITSYLDDWNYADTYGQHNIQALTTEQISQLTINSINNLTTPTITTGPNTVQYNSLNNLKTTKYVIAGNMEQYKAFIKRKGFSETEYQYLYDADMLNGMRNIHGFYVGSWREREDIEEIKQMIYKCNQRV